MKRMLPRIKLVVVIALLLCAWGAQAAHPLLRAVFQSSPRAGSVLSIAPSIPGRAYPYAGIKFLDSRDTVPGCNLNPKNGYCMFSLNGQGATKLPVLPHTFTRNSGKMHFDLALNAAGNKPVSTQRYSTSSAPGRVIGYVYGWEDALPAADLAAAGYTHILIAFGVFTETGGSVSLGALSGNGYDPGSSQAPYDSDLYAYIETLHEAGIKVLLSIGGASTNIPDTTVSLYTAEFGVGTSPNYDPAQFQGNFTAALKTLSDGYGFDGFDFDIESGVSAANYYSDPAKDFADPGAGCTLTDPLSSPCTSYYLISIINDLYQNYFAYSGDRFLISLTPQLPQISATSTYDEIFGLYSAIVMQTYSSLEWVAWQNYNSGCAFGIDGVCYPVDGTTLTSSPDSAVAFATTLLADWPQGAPGNFLPYTSHLTPSQVAIGYLVPNSSGAVDGQGPAVDTTVAKQAIQCLRDNTSCDTYVPPATYPDIGGVFGWTANYDATTGYQFAKALYPCVVGGDCS
ncbi:MAG: glycosyl hydrolase family 18 protein [Legionellaceae bacterium]|nr:glycosyl hydrolase family 18 protein [Legionellaceae bacterium]